MTQSRTHSAIEAATSTVIGAGGSWLICYACAVFFTGPVAITNAAVAGCTAWSLLRGFLVRRAFNRLHAGGR